MMSSTLKNKSKNTEAHELTLEFLSQIPEGDWVSSYQVSKFLSSKEVLCGGKLGHYATSNTASRFLSYLVREGKVEKKRGTGVMRHIPGSYGSVKIIRATTTLWRLKQ